MSLDVVSFTASAAIPTNGTATVNYPANRTAGDYRTLGHLAYARGLMSALVYGAGFTLTLGTSNITFTYKGTTPIPAGTLVTLELDVAGSNNNYGSAPVFPPVAVKRANPDRMLRFNLGAAAAASATFLATSVGVTISVAAVQVATVFDVPRNVVAAWTTTAIITITGTDEYGVAMTEVSASGVAHTGSKAFKTVTSIVPNATITGFTAGSGVKLGLPVYVEGSGMIIAELQDFAAAVAGTLVGGNTTAPSTSATGDSRGTYTPNATPDGSKKFGVIVAVDDPSYMGLLQA